MKVPLEMLGIVLVEEQMTPSTDVFGYIAYGENELYHRGALLSALKLLHHCPGAKIAVATDRPELFQG
ncbi:hypothetical protein ACWGTI_20490 [Mesorhizobium sp. ArgA1]